MRLEILRVLQRDTFGVLELSQLFDIRQSGMSHHLKVLARAGLLEPQREGNAIFYRRPLQQGAETLASQTMAQIFALIDQTALPPPACWRPSKRYARQRSEQSQAFFARHAEAIPGAAGTDCRI